MSKTWDGTEWVDEPPQDDYDAAEPERWPPSPPGTQSEALDRLIARARMVLFVFVLDDYGDPIATPLPLPSGTPAYFFSGDEGDPWPFAGLYDGHSPDGVTPAALTRCLYQPQPGDHFMASTMLNLTPNPDPPLQLMTDFGSLHLGYYAPARGIDAPFIRCLMERGTPETVAGGHPGDDLAAAIRVDATGFTGNLETTDDDVQKVADKVDGLTLGGGSGVETIVEGDNVTVDDTDPANPIVGVPSVPAADVTGFDAAVRTSRLDQMAAPTVPVSMNTHRITDLAAPSSANDAARKVYVDDADALKAPLANPTFTGNVVVPDADAATEAMNRQTSDVRYARVGPSVVTTKTTTYTAVDRDVVLASSSGGAWALTLPAVASGAWVTVKKTDASANAITVTPASGTIDGAATFPISTQWVSRDFVSDGTNWWVV